MLHTSRLIAKRPTGNTGHPLIVAEQLTPNNAPNPFFVQFTGNSDHPADQVQVQLNTAMELRLDRLPTSRSRRVPMIWLPTSMRTG